ncbi:MAG: prolyl oligopeptidase family serine peptidase [Dokdonella sp.]|uniref:prolyl oligopeptidase family serine peptidase n=1 Tax=Dokdonella sp. TaxID=2291710 RepID=UPI0025C08B3D|nr:prolyl oligopeptidase family serine peptidase [Dokdonella sp.]MBZ0222647.1 prolyl oligopeptidase family serine peptidase [Dokdonella sp.]
MKPALLPCATTICAALLAACAPVAHKDSARTAAPSTAPAAVAVEDPFLWLEDIQGAKPLQWVDAQNARTAAAFADTPEFEAARNSILGILDSEARIPYINKIGAHYYNFWKDKAHPRGIWRRTSLAEYGKAQPRWETVLDLDALGKAEGKSWVWSGAQCLRPANQRCLLSLSPGGGDAVVVREFDLHDKAFVKGGFELPEAKTQVAWIDADHLFVATDFGPGSMTKSSYARIVKDWQRGTPLSAATTVYEGKDEDMVVSAERDLTKGFERDFVTRTIDFYTSETFLRGKDGKLTRIEVPLDASIDTHRQWLTVRLRDAWTVAGKTWPSGALLATRFDDFMAGKRDFVLLFAPDDSSSLASFSWTRHHLILNLLKDVASQQEVLTPSERGEWKRAPLGGVPSLSTANAGGIDADTDDSYFLNVGGFLEPDTLSMGTLGRGQPRVLKRGPAFFDASGLAVQQFFVKSKDGTRVPYFQIGAKDLKLDGTHPTLLYGYGGFEISQRPRYNGVVGSQWLARGGVYVVANIRGGGEYGPRWHQAALKANRLRAYEDFAAIAEDLVSRGVTTGPRLGAMGGSNGGLLMGNMLTLYPEHFGAIVCTVPLLDMKRYTHLSAGASWIAEYGDPDKPEEWNWIKTFSPYQNLARGKDYPPILFYTATSDDRVGPVQARKMAARMEEFGYPHVWFYENREGGHGGAADNRQQAYMNALAYGFLWQELTAPVP